jgi:hypothetical protein
MSPQPVVTQARLAPPATATIAAALVLVLGVAAIPLFGLDHRLAVSVAGPIVHR